MGESREGDPSTRTIVQSFQPSLVYHSSYTTDTDENNTVGTQSDITSESGGFLSGMIQAIYPVVVTTDDIFQNGESESTGSQDYLSVACDVPCESGRWESSRSNSQPGVVLTEQGFQYGWSQYSLNTAGLVNLKL